MKPFSLFQTPSQPPPPPAQITEQMLIPDLPTEVFNDFVSVFNSISENSTYKPIERASSVEQPVKDLNEDTFKLLFGPLLGLARQLDSGKSQIGGFQSDLSQSKLDLNDSSHVRSTPTAFISRYCIHLQDSSIQVSQSIQALSGQLSVDRKAEPSKSVSNLLLCQHQSILRFSSRLSRLEGRLDELIVQSKLPIQYQPKIEEAAAGVDSSAQKLQSLYDEYKAEKRRKLEKRSLNSDLFGSSTLPPPSSTSKFSLFGGQKPTISIAPNISNRPKSDAPPPTPSSATTKKSPFS